MNVKLKMPKFGRKLNGGSMLRELMLSTLATTISILLTFGTAHLVEQRHARQAQRQTAMMLIHDIDGSVTALNHMAESEEKQKSAIQYVIDHLDQIESLPTDTIYTAISMLGTQFSDGNYFDDSKEKIFNSSQDTWKNLDDVSFVDNMERFYEARHYLEALFTQAHLWKYPMSQEEFHELSVKASSDRQVPLKIYTEALKEKLKDAKIRYYIDYSTYRARTLRQYAQYWKRLSDRNKFIMNIDDEELAEYVRKSQRSGRAVGESDIIGQWEYEIGGNDMQYRHFMKPDSFSIKTETHYENPFYSGDIIITYTYGGKWEIKGDSLILKYSPESVKTEVDRSTVSYRAEMRDSVETFIKRYFQPDQLTERVRKQLKSMKETLGISTNKTGDKIELVRGRSDDPENENVSYIYLKRSKEKKW